VHWWSAEENVPRGIIRAKRSKQLASFLSVFAKDRVERSTNEKDCAGTIYNLKPSARDGAGTSRVLSEEQPITSLQ
jgi:hypothetical protein